MGFLGAALGGIGGGIVGGAVVQLILDDARFQAGLAKAKGQTAAASTSIGAGFSKAGALAQAGMLAAIPAVVALGRSAVTAFNESEAAIAQTNAVLESTGGVAGVTAADVELLSSKMQELTTFSDEEARSAQNLLLTFTKINRDVFPDTLEVVLDMSTALGTDLKSSAIQVGKALQDPIRGLSTLRRVGVNFNDAQQETIRGLVESGDLMKAQKLILGELSNEFGGSAKAAAGTFAGQMKQLSNEFNDVLEQLGALIAELGESALPVLRETADVLNEDVLPAVTFLTEKLGELGEVLPDDWLEHFKRGLKGAIAPGIDLFKEFGDEAGNTDLTLKDLGVTQDELNSIVAQGKGEIRDIADAFLPFIGGAEDAGDAIGRTGRRIRGFAHMTETQLKDWKESVKTDIAEASLTIGGLGEDWKQTARETVRATRRMARDARTMADDMDELADIKAAPAFKKWLVEQGPGWIHGYVEATRSGKEDIEGYWKEASRASRDQKDALDEVTGKVRGVGRAIDNLPKSKDIDINLRVHATGIADTAAGRDVANALANQLVRTG